MCKGKYDGLTRKERKQRRKGKESSLPAWCQNELELEVDRELFHPARPGERLKLTAEQRLNALMTDLVITFDVLLALADTDIEQSQKMLDDLLQRGQEFLRTWEPDRSALSKRCRDAFRMGVTTMREFLEKAPRQLASDVQDLLDLVAELWGQLPERFVAEITGGAQSFFDWARSVINPNPQHVA